MSLMMSQNASCHAVYVRGNSYHISYATSECALGQVLVARTLADVCAIRTGTANKLAAELAASFLKAKLVTNEPILQDDLARVTRSVNTPTVALDLPLDLRGTALRHRVWEKLRAIPHLALSRAAASACAANRIALAVPCQSVVSDGGLADYRWGGERKHELIRKEATA